MDTSVSLSVRSQTALSDSDDGEAEGERTATEADHFEPYMHQGGEPLRKHVSRTQEVTKSTWESFVAQTRGRRNSGVFAVALEPPVHLKSQTRIWRSSFAGRKKEQDGENTHRSICGWPTLTPYGTVAVWWSGFMVLVDAIYTAFLVPIVIAFDPQAHKGWSTMLEFVAGTLFCVDVVLNFTFGYIISYDFKKKVVMKGSSIFWYYLRHGGAWMDFLAVSPLVYKLIVEFGGGDDRAYDDLSIDVWLTALRLARLLRLIRLVRIIFSTSMMFQGATGAGNFVNILYCGAVMVNMLGCLLFSIARWEGLENSWLSEYEKDINFIEAGDVVRSPADSSFPRLYLASIYWATVTITTVGYGDISPVTSAETVVVMFVMVTHVVLFGLLVGSASEMLKNASRSTRQAARLRHKLTCVGNWITHRGLPTEMEKKVRSYYNEVWSGGVEYSEAQLLEELPVGLRSEIILFLVGPTLRRLRVFRSLSEGLLEVVAGRLCPISVAPGHDISRQGDVAERVLILTEGRIHGFVDNIMVDKLCPPATIGEESVLVTTRLKMITHFTSYRTMTSCHFWELKRQDLVALCDSVPNLKNQLLVGCKDNIEANLRYSERLGVRSIGALNAWKGLLHHLDGVKEFKLDRSAKISRDLNQSEVDEAAKMKQVEHSVGIIQASKRADDEEEGMGKVTVERSHLSSLKNQLRKNGVHGLVEFARTLENSMEVAEQLGCGAEAFKECVSSQGLDNSDVLAMCNKYLNKSTVLWKELIKELYYPGVSSNRLRAVGRAFDRLSQAADSALGHGMIPLTRLVGSFRADSHPDVSATVKSAFTATSELLSAFKGVDIVTRGDFLKYFSFVSVCVEEDSDFEHLCEILFEH